MVDDHSAGRGRADGSGRRAEAPLSQAALDALSTQLCVLDEHGTILATNRAWREFAAANSPTAPRTDAGVNYLEVCDTATGADAADAAEFADGLRAVIRGERECFTQEYPCHSPLQQRWFAGRVSSFPPGAPARAVVVHENITERKRAEQKIRDQLAELLRWQRVMHAREDRVRELKAEVNALLAAQGLPARYPSQSPR